MRRPTAGEEGQVAARMPSQQHAQICCAMEQYKEFDSCMSCQFERRRKSAAGEGDGRRPPVRETEDDGRRRGRRRTTAAGEEDGGRRPSARETDDGPVGGRRRRAAAPPSHG
ncbi:unnamed protein product [Urochloa humidicola]